jgi:hypothetical protein
MFLIVNNLNLNEMSSQGKNTSLIESDQYYYPENRIKWLVFRFTISGIAVSVLWLCLFVAGLLVDSSYYRAAISYNFAGVNDWFMSIIAFTFSNVVLLAFMSGLLGGITSKLHYTKGFKITVGEFKNTNSFQVENPFISAFRGMFVFIAILFMQYVSSFSDLGALNKLPEQEQKNMEVKFEKIYSRLAGNGQDTGTLNKVRSEIDKQLAEGKIAEPDSAVMDSIFSFNENLRVLKHMDNKTDSQKEQKTLLEGKIRSLRRGIKVPSNSDFSGIGLSSFSYFKFAVIVSFLSFMSGYDPSLFKLLTDRILKPKDENGTAGAEKKRSKKIQ